MRYIDTPYGNLIISYARYCDGLSDEEIDRALRAHAQRWGGCISCRYSIAHPSCHVRDGNIWYKRGCQVGLSQDNCPMHTPFPKEGDIMYQDKDTGQEVAMMKVTGIAITEDQWLVSCPVCGCEMEFEGFFDPEDVYECRTCNTKFICTRITFENGSYIE